MGYFLANLIRDTSLWVRVGLAALAGLMTMDFLTLMLTPRAVFGMWTFKLAAIGTVAGVVIYGLFLRRQDTRTRKLRELLPRFQEERRAFLLQAVGNDPGFQTFCHECRHFDRGRLGCRLVLRERKVRIRLHDESQISHCLYWNLEDAHPVMLLTKKLDAKARLPDKGERSRA